MDIKFILQVGEARQMMKNLMDKHERLEMTSKHDTYWESEHDKESEKLYDLRCTMRDIHDKLWDIYAKLQYEEEE